MHVPDEAVSSSCTSDQESRIGKGLSRFKDRQPKFSSQLLTVCGLADRRDVSLPGRAVLIGGERIHGSPASYSGNGKVRQHLALWRQFQRTSWHPGGGAEKRGFLFQFLLGRYSTCDYEFSGTKFDTLLQGEDSRGNGQQSRCVGLLQASLAMRRLFLSSFRSPRSKPDAVSCRG